MDEETISVIEGIHNGTLATKIKKSTKYATTGIAVGAVAGFLIASVFGKSKIGFSFLGAAAGATIGYINSPAKIKNN